MNGLHELTPTYVLSTGRFRRLALAVVNAGPDGYVAITVALAYVSPFVLWMCGAIA